MAEVAFSCAAQVHILDKAQRTWIPLTESIVLVQFTVGDTYKVKATDPAKAGVRTRRDTEQGKHYINDITERYSI
jgi:hypothetical protein